MQCNSTCSLSDRIPAAEHAPTVPDPGDEHVSNNLRDSLDLYSDRVNDLSRVSRNVCVAILQPACETPLGCIGIAWLNPRSDRGVVLLPLAITGMANAERLLSPLDIDKLLFWLEFTVEESKDISDAELERATTRALRETMPQRALRSLQVGLQGGLFAAITER